MNQQKVTKNEYLYNYNLNSKPVIIQLLKSAAISLIILTTVFFGFSKNSQDANLRSGDARQLSKGNGLTLMGNRFFTLSTVVRVNQIETSRDKSEGTDESSVHGPEEARIFRETIEKSWPGARITWAFSWLALKDQRTNCFAYHLKF
jgi:hypothetical protein